MRAAIGDLMAKSKREIPHYYLTQSIDLRTAMEWMREVNAGRGVAERLVPAVLLLKAVAAAVAKVPEVNGFYTDGALPAQRERAPRGRGVPPWWRTRGAGDPRRADARPRRPDGRAQGRRRQSARRTPEGLGDVRPHDHGDEPG